MPANLLIGLSGWFPSSKGCYGLLDNVDPSKPKQFPLRWSGPSPHPTLSRKFLVASCAEDSPLSFHPSSPVLVAQEREMAREDPSIKEYDPSFSSSFLFFFSDHQSSKRLSSRPVKIKGAFVIWVKKENEVNKSLNVFLNFMHSSICTSFFLIWTN